MIFNPVVIALALSAASSATSTLHARDDCQDAYKACIAAGTAEVACSCTLTACVGEDNARNREFCATATANLPKPTTSIPGGCNPAHPGSCPSSYFLTSTKSVAATATPCTPLPTVAATPVAPVPGYSSSNLVLVPGKEWTIANLTRYCGQDNSGCDYNFAVVANGKTERCTVVRMPGSKAATESWSNRPCTTGSDLIISWGYAEVPAPPYAVITINSGKELAWFGVANVNSGRVTTSSPFGSGVYGTLPASPVYIFK